MSEIRDYGELFAHSLVRHSMELASTLWGASVCIIDGALRAYFPAVTPLPVAETFSALLMDKRHGQQARSLESMFVGTPDWTGPRWFQIGEGVRALVAPVGGALGVSALVCVPFVLFSESEKQDHEALVQLERLLKKPGGGGLADMAPSLEGAERRKLQTHMSTLCREVDALMSRTGRRAGDAPRRVDVYAGVAGASAVMEEVRKRAKSLAQDDSPVLVWGEMGSGKRTISRLMHEFSQRRAHPFVSVDCQVTPVSDLVAGVLGKGWTPGTVTELEKVGAGGTVVFNEIAFLPTLLQQVVLRYCDGWDTGGTVVRVIATSSRTPDGIEKLDALRPELLYLLRASDLELPPLRAHREDIPALSQEMLLRLRTSGGDFPSEISKEVLRLLQAHDWPGNLWELKGEIRQMAIRARGKSAIVMQDVSPRLAAGGGKVAAASRDSGDVRLSLPEAVESLERTMLMNALNSTRWNRSRTARLLGISRRNLIRKIAAYQLDRRKSLKTPDQM